MNFSIVFSNTNYVVEVLAHPIGLNALDEARKQIGCNFPANLMQDRVPIYARERVEIFLTEEQARKTNLFAKTNEERVNVTGNLNKFTKLCLRTERDSITDAILYVWYEYNIDKESVLQAWVNDGCPLEWTP